MAPAQSKRRSRKRRRAAAAERVPRQAPSPPPPRRRVEPPRGALATTLTGRTYGEPPPNRFGGVPVSEIAIFAGAVGAAVGVVSRASPVLIVGVVVCTLGVLEFTVREHFSGYRSHTALLSAIPAMGIVALSVAAFGSPHQRSTRELMLAAAVPVFAVLFWILRNRFAVARQARLVRPPGP